jgi:hypothetical protein
MYLDVLKLNNYDVDPVQVCPASCGGALFYREDLSVVPNGKQNEVVYVLQCEACGLIMKLFPHVHKFELFPKIKKTKQNT